MIQPFESFVPNLHPTAWVHEGAWVIGEVELAADVSIWPTAVLRGDMGPIVIGEASNLQDGVVCHNTGGLSTTRVGDRVTVGHRAILHGCVIGDDCLVGMGSIVMDNAIIGAGSIVAAGALVPARKEFPPGVLLVGSPATVSRDLTDAERRWVAGSWKIYLERARSWRASAG